ncbi:MAG: VCBS repeat-containing protein [Candidatus Woesearchaeota archaeon]
MIKKNILLPIFILLIIISFSAIVISQKTSLQKANSIKNIDDSDMLYKFTHLKGYKSISFDISSSKDFNINKVEKIDTFSDKKVGNIFKLNNLAVETEYKEVDTSFFNTDTRPVKQTYIIKNLLDKSRDIKLNIKYEIDSSTITWNGTEYEITETPKHFEAFYVEDEFFPDNELSPEIAIKSLTGHTLYFGNNYYDFKDVVDLDYKVLIYSKENKNYIGLEIKSDIDSLEEFVIDPEIGWTTRIVDNSAKGARDVFAIDMDNDNDIDVVGASFAGLVNKIAWYENDGNSPPSWTTRNISTIIVWSEPRSVYAIDIDNDNDIDVLTASSQDNRVAWYENDGGSPPSWTTRNITTSVDAAQDVFAIDIDNDNDIDVLSASYYDNKIAWYENDGSTPPSWTTRNITTSANGARSVFAIDMDNDNDIDVLSASGSKVAWYENDGSTPPSWTARTITTSANAPRRVFAIDMDNDNDIDVLSANYDKIAWYENDGSTPPSWTARTITTSVGAARDVFAIDIDNDKDIDVLSASSHDDKIAWYENDGSTPPSWTTRIITTSADAAYSVYAIDIDNDGDVDALSASTTDGKIAWYESRLDPSSIYKYLWVPFGNWNSQQEFENDAKKRADFFLEISPLQSCKSKAQNIYIDIDWVEVNCPYVTSDIPEKKLLQFTEKCAKAYILDTGIGPYEKAISFSKDDFCDSCAGKATLGGKYAYAETEWSGVEHLEIAAHELGHTYFVCDEYKYLGTSGWSNENNELLLKHGFGCPNPWTDTYDEYNETHSNHPCLEDDSGRCIREGKCCGAFNDPISHYDGIYSAAGNDCTDETTYNVVGWGGTERRCGYSTDSYNKLAEFLTCSDNLRSNGNGNITNVSYLGLLFNITNPTQENVTLGDSFVHRGLLPKKLGVNDSLYELKITNANNQTIDSDPLPVFYFELVQYDNATINVSDDKNESFIVSELEYTSNWEMLQVYKNDSLIYEVNISHLLCNENDICDEKENFFSCPQDCSSGSSDNICDGQDDGICDPDCYYSADANCALDLTNLTIVSQNGTEFIFRFVINNFWNNTISNISWILDPEINDIMSELTLNLETNETAFVYVEYDYTNTGNYTVLAAVETSELSDTETVSVEVI